MDFCVILFIFLEKGISMLDTLFSRVSIDRFAFVCVFLHLSK